MAKFTITFKDPDNDRSSIIGQVAYQNKLDEDAVYDLVDRFAGEYVTLQFDTEAGTCAVLEDGDNGVNDYNSYGKTAVDVEEDEDAAWEIEELTRQVKQTRKDYEDEPDKESRYAKGLLKFIIDTNAEIKNLKINSGLDDV